MRSQEDDGKQQRESQPDHTPEADQASQDKLGPQSVTLGLAAQPVVVSVCWCWGGRGNEVAWVGGVAGERGGKDLSCFWVSRLPNVILKRLGICMASKTLEWGQQWWWEGCGKDRPGDYWADFSIPSFPLCPESCQHSGDRRQEREEATGFRLLRRDGGRILFWGLPSPSAHTHNMTHMIPHVVLRTVT